MVSQDEFKTYLFSYNHDGASWLIEIKASDEDDARGRIGKLAYATYAGELVARLPADTGPLARVLVWARNSIQALIPVGINRS